MVPGGILMHQLEPGHAVAEVKPLHHTHFDQDMHGSIHGRQIAFTVGQDSKDLAIGQRMWLAAQDVENGPARPGDFS